MMGVGGKNELRLSVVHLLFSDLCVNLVNASCT